MYDNFTDMQEAMLGSFKSKDNNIFKRYHITILHKEDMTYFKER